MKTPNLICLLLCLDILISPKQAQAQKNDQLSKLECYVGPGISFTTGLAGSAYDKNVFSTFIPSVNLKGEVVYGHQLGKEASLHAGLGFGVLHYRFKLDLMNPNGTTGVFTATTAAMEIEIPLYAKFTVLKNSNGILSLTAGGAFGFVNQFSQGFTASNIATENTSLIVSDVGFKPVAMARGGLESNHLGENGHLQWFVLFEHQITASGEMEIYSTSDTGNDIQGVLHPGSITAYVGLHVPLVK